MRTGFKIKNKGAVIMFYVKKEIAEGIEIKLALYNDEIFTLCDVCGKDVMRPCKYRSDLRRMHNKRRIKSLLCKKISQSTIEILWSAVGKLASPLLL
jgi:hypothetical protein